MRCLGFLLLLIDMYVYICEELFGGVIKDFNENKFV